jgi:outer membrane immunogenic protein
MRFIATVLAALVVSVPALAADLPPAPPPRAAAMYVPVQAPVYNWGGIYLGINGGYGFGNSNWNGGGLSTGNFNTNGFLVGGTLGFNYQINALVWGVETDLDYSGITGSTSSCNAAGVVGASCRTANTWLGTTRGRLGYAADRVLFYGTGGVAYGDLQALAAGVTTTNTQVGWTAGAGVEAAFAENWTAKLEYFTLISATRPAGQLAGVRQSTLA